MKAVQVLRHGAPSAVVAVNDVPVPNPGAGEVRVKVAAASVNFGDIARARGGVSMAMFQPPYTLGMDVAGTVEAAGEGAEAWRGKRVVGMSKWAFGGMAEFAIVPLPSLFEAPAGLGDAEAAALLLPGHVGYLGLHTRAKLQPGEWVLVTAGASAVGTAALQIAAAAGARVIATAGGIEKAAYCRALSAEAVIDPAQEKLFDRVMALTEGHGVDVAYDLVGGDATEAVWTCMALEGRYLPIGFNGDAQGGLTGKPLRKISTANFSVLGVMLAYGVPVLPMRGMGLNFYPPETGQAIHSALCALVADGKLKPAIGCRIRMDEVGAALEEHEARRTSGRTVVDIAGSL